MAAPVSLTLELPIAAGLIPENVEIKHDFVSVYILGSPLRSFMVMKGFECHARVLVQVCLKFP